MALVDVQMISGFEANSESFEKVDKYIKRFFEQDYPPIFLI